MSRARWGLGHDSCNFYLDGGLKILSQKPLIYMDLSKIWMYDLVQEMGQEIVHQESPENPGKHGRLWYHEDILSVLWENSVSFHVNICIFMFLKTMLFKNYWRYDTTITCNVVLCYWLVNSIYVGACMKTL